MSTHREFRTSGWLYLGLGVLAIVCGLGSLVMPGNNKIYVGAILVGPYLLYRGVQNLRVAADLGSRSDYEKGLPDAVHPDGLEGIARRPDSIGIPVQCEGCQKLYLYFPIVTNKSRNDFLARGCSAAPCPRCGWYSRAMLATARAYAPVPYVFTLGLVVLFIAAWFFVATTGVASSNTAEPAVVRNYWIALGVIVATGATLTWWGSARMNRWDPNVNQPEHVRLGLGKKLGMPVEDVELLRQELSGEQAWQEPDPSTAIRPTPSRDFYERP